MSTMFTALSLVSAPHSPASPWCPITACVLAAGAWTPWPPSQRRWGGCPGQRIFFYILINLFTYLFSSWLLTNCRCSCVFNMFYGYFKIVNNLCYPYNISGCFCLYFSMFLLFSMVINNINKNGCLPTEGNTPVPTSMIRGNSLARHCNIFIWNNSCYLYIKVRRIVEVRPDLFSLISQGTRVLPLRYIAHTWTTQA